MLAEIFSGERDWSDVLLLIAIILFVVAAVFDVRGGTITRDGRPGYGVLVALGLAAVAFGWLLL